MPNAVISIRRQPSISQFVESTSLKEASDAPLYVSTNGPEPVVAEKLKLVLVAEIMSPKPQRGPTLADKRCTDY